MIVWSVLFGWKMRGGSQAFLGQIKHGQTILLTDLTNDGTLRATIKLNFVGLIYSAIVSLIAIEFFDHCSRVFMWSIANSSY